MDFHLVCDRFLSHIADGSIILDYGCGSGRDTKYFLSKNYCVDAMDGSPELCRFAETYTGIPVKCMLFNGLDTKDKYEGIWACSSILHVSTRELPDVFKRMIYASKTNEHIYTSFNYRDFEGEVNGRYFSNSTTESFDAYKAVSRTACCRRIGIKRCTTWKRRGKMAERYSSKENFPLNIDQKYYDSLDVEAFSLMMKETHLTAISFIG